jgi:hypothetical protein
MPAQGAAYGIQFQRGAPRRRDGHASGWPGKRSKHLLDSECGSQLRAGPVQLRATQAAATPRPHQQAHHRSAFVGIADQVGNPGLVQFGDHRWLGDHYVAQHD